MTKNNELFILLIVFISTLVVYISNVWFLSVESELVKHIPKNFVWILHGIQNTLGYATVFLPGYLIFRYVSDTNYLNKSGRGPLGGVIRTCFSDEEQISVKLATNLTSQSSTSRTPLHDAFLLLFYFFGLQVSYLSWGVLQEKIMTQKYVSGADSSYFKDSQFLVFVNRKLAFLMSAAIIFCTRQPRHTCPLYKYVFCSFSNIMSSWCQYEALKYVSFPYQVLAKASKTIPVMIMGKLVSKTKYEFYEYVTAVILSIGMLFFMIDTTNDRSDNAVTTFSGAILLCSYIIFDSFTSNWQGKLFKTYEMKPIQMMCFVNFFSCLFTTVSLLQQTGFVSSFNFIIKYPSFMIDVVVLSVCSAAGQMFIFYTIDAFGPLVFVIISTIRQGMSVLLSCLIYHHQIHTLGVLGVITVFLSMLLRIYCGYRTRKVKQSNLVGFNLINSNKI